MNSVEINIFYFDEVKFFEYLELHKKGASKIPPAELSWDYFFVSKKGNHVVEEVLETSDGLKFLIVENDIIWYGTIPVFKDGRFYWITPDADNKLYSLKSMRVKENLWEKLFNLKIYDSFSEYYKILDRNDKLKKLEI
jgi:hypothetical protein